MKKLIDVENEGLVSLLGETVTLICVNYIYTGKLSGVNADCVLLENAKIVYETGAFTDPQWKNSQSLPGNMYVMTALIESFGIVK